MDVMSPDLLWIGDRCYRLPVLDAETGENTRSLEKSEWFESETPFDCLEQNCEDEEVETDLIETLPNNKYKLSLPIPQTFWSKIIGAKGVTRKRIENDTNTTIMIPRPMERGDVVIKGTSKKSLILAKKNIEAIVFSSRQKLVFTHFISIPMNSENVKKNFIIFKEEVLKLFGKDRGIDDSIFQNPDKLHLTIGTLVLTDQNERNLAEKLLTEVSEKSVRPLIVSQKNPIIEMKGVEYMNDDPAEVDVLYGKVSSKDDIIQKMADVILKHFSEHKLIKSDEKEEVKLHVTLMNTLFREEEPDECNVEIDSMNKNKWNKKTRRTFNAVNILSSHLTSDASRTVNYSNFRQPLQNLCRELGIKSTNSHLSESVLPQYCFTTETELQDLSLLLKHHWHIVLSENLEKTTMKSSNKGLYMKIRNAFN